MTSKGKYAPNYDQSKLIALAVQFAGTKAALAKTIQCSEDSIYKWSNNRQIMNTQSILKIKDYIDKQTVIRKQNI